MPRLGGRASYSVAVAIGEKRAGGAINAGGRQPDGHASPLVFTSRGPTPLESAPGDAFWTGQEGQRLRRLG